MGHALVSAAHPLSHSRHRVFPQEHSNVANSAGLSAVGVRPAMPAPRSALAPSGLSLGNPKRRHGGVGILSSSTRQGIGKKSKTIQIARIGWCKGISTPLVTRSTLRITAFRCGVAHYGRVGRPTRSLLLTTAVTITAVTVATLITSAAPLRLCGKPVMGARAWFGSVGLAVAIAVACYLVALCDFQRSWQSKKLLRNQKRRQYRKSKCGGLLATRGLVIFCPMKRDIRAWQYEKG
jgi:hypothetical protein